MAALRRVPRSSGHRLRLRAPHLDTLPRTAESAPADEGLGLVASCRVRTEAVLTRRSAQRDCGRRWFPPWCSSSASPEKDHATPHSTVSCAHATSLRPFLSRLPAALPDCEPRRTKDRRSTRSSPRPPSPAGRSSPQIPPTCGPSPPTHPASPSRQSKSPSQPPTARTPRHRRPTFPPCREQMLMAVLTALRQLLIACAKPWHPQASSPADLLASGTMRGLPKIAAYPDIRSCRAGT
jgi:hypothetical protein